MIAAIRHLAETLPLEKHYTWEIPSNAPIDIPQDITDAFSRNIYLKENLAKKLENELSNDNKLDAHYWIIREWGGIKTFQINEHNNQNIREFRKQLNHNRLKRSIFNLISSLSKLAAFWYPAKYSIYDSRAIFSLNWLIFRHSNNRRLFPQPIGRSKVVSMYDTATLFRLSDQDYTDRDWKTSYHEYCELLRHLAKEALNKDRPYYVEMLLFVSASTFIVEDIRKNTKIQININNQQ
jgi:hypothetical protein